MITPISVPNRKPYNPAVNYDSSREKTSPVTDQGYNIACYNHDCRYACPAGLTRADCDLMFLMDMEEAGVGFAKRHIAYTAVRMFGGTAWRRCRQND